ncbi:MAG: glutathione S-transferase N-terminal domain-containing protein [Novosphingobium sp.]|nr:glutathione S-transferase N-terminal domain-containing protein [Novosphingobium sp.]
MIELFGMSSPNVRKVLIALEEMELDYDPRHIAVFRGHQFDEEFLSLSPMAKVPVLVDAGGPASDQPMFESGAILIYLAETYGPAFLPAGGPARYAVLKWLMLQVANVGPALGQHSHFRLQADDNPYAARRFRHMAAQVYYALERRLGEAEWLGGDAYSIADMAVWPWARYLDRHGLDRAEFNRLTAWEQRIGERPAVVRADAVVRRYAEQDRIDRATATPQERGRFLGLHIPAPSAQAAARTTKETKGM